MRLRVRVLIGLSSVIWVPIGVYIGLRPRVAAATQPVTQFLAAFPANLLFPVVVCARVVLYDPQAGSEHRAQEPFLAELEDYMTEQSAEQTLRALISWGRYAEIFAYDDQRQLFSLENPA